MCNFIICFHELNFILLISQIFLLLFINGNFLLDTRCCTFHLFDLLKNALFIIISIHILESFSGTLLHYLEIVSSSGVLLLSNLWSGANFVPLNNVYPSDAHQLFYVLWDFSSLAAGNTNFRFVWAPIFVSFAHFCGFIYRLS